MTNEEKFKDWFEKNKTELICSKSFGVNVNTSTPFLCNNSIFNTDLCNKCRLHLNGECGEARKHWLKEEAIIDNLKKGSKLLVYDEDRDVWIKRYFCAKKGDVYYVFAKGCDEFTAERMNGHPVCEEYKTVVPYLDNNTIGRKYLDELNVTERPDLWNPEDHRQEKWAEERAEYGFDERETWSMDTSFYCWLYERIMFYKEFVDTDLTFHRITYNNIIYTQGELIDEILKRLKVALLDRDWRTSCDDRSSEYIREIEKMWAVLLPYMWW